MAQSKNRDKQNANLIPTMIHKGDLSKEELRKRQSNGGKKSAQARREKKLLREGLAERTGYSDWAEMIDNLIKRAKKYDKSFEVYRDTIGEKPVDRTETTIIEPPKPLSPRKQKEEKTEQK